MASVCSVGILLNNVALKCCSPVGVREYPGDLRDWNARGYPARTFGKANPGYPAREVGRSIACSMRGGQKQVQTFNFRLKWVSYRVDTIKIRKSRHLGKTVEFEWPKLSQLCEPGSASRDIRLSSNFVT